MKHVLAIVFAHFLALPAVAQQVETAIPDPLFLNGTGVELSEFLWINRPVVVFADSKFDPRFVQQMELLEDRRAELSLRDVIVLTDTDPAAKSALRKKLRPRGFMLVLIGKDGNVYLRKPFPWDVREITRSIDKLPMRQQEMQDRRVSPTPEPE